MLHTTIKYIVLLVTVLLIIGFYIQIFENNDDGEIANIAENVENNCFLLTCILSCLFISVCVLIIM